MSPRSYLTAPCAGAIGSNEEATELSGINTRRWKILIYTFAGLFTGLAGVLVSARLNSAQPALGMGYELQAIAVVVIGGTSLFGGVDRRDGFVNWMKKNAPDIKLLQPQYSASDMSKAANIAKAILASHPDLNGLFASNEASAAGAALGIRESGKKDVVAVGFDSGKAQIDAIKNGVLAGSITQNPVGKGKQFVDAALKVINGKSVPKTIDTGYYWYDKKNLDDPKISGNLYE